MHLIKHRVQLFKAHQQRLFSVFVQMPIGITAADALVIGVRTGHHRQIQLGIGEAVLVNVF